MLSLITRALAAPTPPDFNSMVVSPNDTGIGTIIARGISWFLLIAGAIAVIYLVYGGILYITAGGDAEKATKGRTAVINAVIGIIIILLAWVIVQWVNTAVTSNAS